MSTIFIFNLLLYIMSHVPLSYVIKGLTYLLTYLLNVNICGVPWGV